MRAEELDAEAHRPIQRQIQADDLPLTMRPHQSVDQNCADHSFGQRFVDLGRMQRNSEWNSRRRIRIVERNSPRQTRGLAPAASGRKTTKPADSMADGNARRKEI